MISLKRHAATLPHDTYLLRIPHEHIHVLQQVRATMDDERYEQLRTSIEHRGQETPGLVIALTKEASRAYLREVTRLWGMPYDLHDFRSVNIEGRTGGSHYLFLVAGHRRLRAVRELQIPLYYCHVRFGVKFADAVVAQFHENQHEPISKDDEARFISFLWRCEREKSAKVSLAQFARTYARSPDALRKMLRFADLPIELQNLVLPQNGVFSRGVPFGILCEVARLQAMRMELGKPHGNEELIAITKFLLTQFPTQKQAASWVSDRIREAQGQQSLFELTPNLLSDTAKKTIRTKYEKTVEAGRRHLAAIARFGDDDIPSLATNRAVEGVRDVIAKIGPQLAQKIRGRGSRRAKRAVREI